MFQLNSCTSKIVVFQTPGALWHKCQKQDHDGRGLIFFVSRMKWGSIAATVPIQCIHSWEHTSPHSNTGKQWWRKVWAKEAVNHLPKVYPKRLVGLIFFVNQLIRIPTKKGELLQWTWTFCTWYRHFSQVLYHGLDRTRSWFLHTDYCWYHQAVSSMY